MSSRKIYFLGFILTVLLLGTSIGLQIFDGIMPCPLCSLQRIAFGLLGIFFLLGIVVAKHRLGRIIINILAGFSAIAGMFFAGRQVWLQQFPPADNTECGVSLNYMIKVLPLKDVMLKILSGSAECTQRGFEFLYFNMAEWAFIWFVFFLILIIYLFSKDLKRK